MEISAKDWTLLVYQGAANNLQSSLAKNLQELAQAGAPDNIDVVVRQVNLAGERQDWVVKGPSLEPLSLTPPPLDVVDSSDPSELSQFLKAAMAKYPAKHYMLVVSSHGQGAHGLIEDERVHRLMSVSDFAEALGPTKLDVVYFDACRMMTAEVAYELQDKADFMLGSMDRIDSAGYDPSVLLKELAQSPTPKLLVDRLVHNQESRQLSSFCTLSAAELSGMPTLKEALAQLSGELLQLSEPEAESLRRQLQTARRSLPSPGFQDALYNQGCALVDRPDPSELQEWVSDARPADPVSLVDFCRCLLESERPELRDCAQLVLDRHDQVVFSQREKDCDGLSLLLPLERKPESPWPSNKFSEESGWRAAAEHLVPLNSPAALPLTWVEQELQQRAPRGPVP